MKQLNPIIESLDGIDENLALAAANRRKMKKPLKIVIIAVAAAMLLTTTAAATAATLGEDPLIKLNNRSYHGKTGSYTDQNGWTLKTTFIALPREYGNSGYIPVGEMRPVFNENEDGLDNIIYYDELGVRVDGSNSKMYILTEIEKPGETSIKRVSNFSLSYRHQRMSIDTDGTICIDIWQDPLQAAQEAHQKALIARVPVDEQVENAIKGGWGRMLSGYGGYKHPSLHDIFANSCTLIGGKNILIGSDGSPSALARKLYDCTLDIPEGFAEKDGFQAVSFCDHDAKLVTQQMFIYTLTDQASGKDVKFTVWRSAEKKDTYTDHFGFEYEYITLNNGTKARLHQSGYTYIAEFEKDGAAYAFQCDVDRELVENVLKSFGVL